MTFRQFLDTYHGKRNDFDGAYSTQCVDLFNYYNRDVVGAGWVAGVNGAKDIWTTTDTDIANSYVKLPKDSPVQQGDVLIWSGSMPGSGGYGHVAIAMDDRLNVIEQVPNSAAYTIKRDRNHLLGILRPKKFIKETSMALTSAQVIAEYRTNRGPNGKAPTAAEITLHSTKGTYESLSQGFRPENDARFKAQATEVTKLNTTIKAKDVEIAKLKATITVKDAEIAKLKAELAKPPVAGGFTDADRTTLNAISTTVTAIFNKITGVFK